MFLWIGIAVFIVRVTFPYKDGKPGLNRSGYFSKYNLNKRSVAINLDKPQGRELFLRLVKWADVVIESNAPAVMPKLGLTYDELKKVNRDIIMVSTNLMGQSVPGTCLKLMEHRLQPWLVSTISLAILTKTHQVSLAPILIWLPLSG